MLRIPKLLRTCVRGQASQVVVGWVLMVLFAFFVLNTVESGTKRFDEV